MTPGEGETPDNVSSAQLNEDKNTQRNLILLTWNVDGPSPAPVPRISALLSHILARTPAVDIIFLQEVTWAALTYVIRQPRIRDGWFASHVDRDWWEGSQYKSLTLLSRKRFGYPWDRLEKPTIGKVWRVRYHSLFGREALCCDVFIPSSSPASAAATRETTEKRIRLVNVHLDSRRTQASRRQQLCVVASSLRSVGRGVIPGDFNAFQPEDETLIEDFGLKDAWTEIHPGEPGYTWGIDGKQRYPAARVDKVAMLRLTAKDIEVMHPGVVTTSPAKGEEDQKEQTLPWSDHSGVVCTFEIVV